MPEEEGRGGMGETDGPSNRKMPARLAAGGGGSRRNGPDGRAEQPEDARPSGSRRRRDEAEWARRAGRATGRCPPVWQPEEEGRGGMGQTGGPSNRKMPARLAAGGGGSRRNGPDGRAEQPENACPSGSRMRSVEAEWARRAGRATGRCPPVWQPEEEGRGGMGQTGGPSNRKMPARLAAGGGRSRRNGPDGRAEQPEDARPSGSRRRRVAAEWARRAGRATGRCPPVWLPEEEGRGGMGQTGGLSNRKMPARLAAGGGRSRRNGPDGRAEQPEDARPSGSRRRRVEAEWARRAGRATGRCPPVWQPEEEGRGGMGQTGGPSNRKMPARLAAGGGGSRRNGPDGRAEQPEDARPSGSRRRRVEAEWARRAGRATGKCLPVWQPDEECRGGMGQTGGPSNRKMPARLAAGGGGSRRNGPDGRAEQPEDARPSGSRRRKVEAEWARRAGRATGRCPPVWQPEEEGRGGMGQTGGSSNRKMPARLAAGGGGSRRNGPDGRAEQPEDARPSGSRRRKVEAKWARRAGRATGRCPPVWQPEEEGRGGMGQTGGPSNRKMPARLAAGGGGSRRNGPDGRAEQPEDARPSGSRRRKVEAEWARRAGRATGRCPPVWQPEEEGLGGMGQTGGPSNRKMPARLAAGGGGSRWNGPDGRAEQPEDARPSGSRRRRRVAAEWARRAGRATGRCPPVWQPEEEGRGGMGQTGGPSNRKMPARLAAGGGGSRRNGPDGRAEQPEDARLSGSRRRRVEAEWARRAGRATGRCTPVWQPEEEGRGGMGQTGGPSNRKMPARLAAGGGGSRRNGPDGRAEQPEDARPSGSRRRRSRRNGPDGRAEQPEDARPSGSRRRRVEAEWARRAGRATGRCPPVWQPEEEGRGGMGQTGGPSNRKMPARLAAGGGGIEAEWARRAGRATGRCPPVWQPEDEGRW